ncbi:hypothetical protein [Ottowia thiooxydans]|uniref:hypothetical protein n=1 Tax=Ottowia thiooxydans TaxID=219182 RepID=UPI0003FB55E2|nr:hypothetical protein [Ottowia thiooxydans]
MKHYALQVVDGGDGDWRWVILVAPAGSLVFSEHSAQQDDEGSFQVAMDSGAVALAKLQKQPYENERADPVG